MPILGTTPRAQAPITDITTTTVINWLAGPIFARAIATNTAFTFITESVGQEVTVVITNATAKVVTADFTPSGLNLHWERGEVLNEVGGFQSTVFKFVNLGTYILASVVSDRVRTDLGYRLIDNFFMMDPSDIGYFLSRWEKVSGTGNMTYEASADTGMGYGRFAFDGDCVYRLKDYIAVMPYSGIGGFARYKKSLGTASFHAGVYCFDANKNDLTTSKPFIANSGSVTTSWAFSQGRAKNEGGSSDNLATGTRFVKPYISITAYSGTTTDKVYVSGYNVFTANFSTVADYA